MVSENLTIQKVEGTGEENIASLPITIIPNVVPVVENPVFTFRILDARGLLVNGDSLGDPFNNPTVQPLQVAGTELVLNARSGEITAQKVIGVEIRRAGSAPAFLTVTIQKNSA